MLNVCKDLDNSNFILIFAALNLKAINMSKIYLTMQVNVIINTDDDVDMDDIRDGLDVCVSSCDGRFDVEDSEVKTLEVTDAK